jgi:hydroxymethylpyrimidine pyrophosphatase-like HAD family hydrolase
MCYPEEVDRMVKHYRAVFPQEEVNIVRGSRYIEFIAPHISKGATVLKLADQLGVPRESILAFGVCV